ncbi:MAG: Hsp33 family molecular chaperone HslO [Oscillospiraceae bacterium]
MSEIVRAVTKDGFAKISAIDGLDIVEKARQTHGLSPVCTAALGRTLCATSILGELLKEPDASLTARINGGGPIGSIVCVSDSEGNVRGYVDEPQLDLPLKENGKLDVGSAVGIDGMLTISRDLGLKEPYIGSTKLVSGEIAEDFTYYFAESEQVGAACGLGVLVETDCSAAYAGGFLVQLLPDAPDLLIKQIELNIATMGTVTEVLSIGGVDELVERVLFGLEPEILARVPVEYRCTCSRERVQRAIESMGYDNLKEIYDSGEGAEVCCHFCNTAYKFEHDDIGSILDNIYKNLSE